MRKLFLYPIFYIKKVIYNYLYNKDIFQSISIDYYELTVKKYEKI